MNNMDGVQECKRLIRSSPGKDVVHLSANTSQNLPVSLEEEDSGGSSTPCYGSKVETRDRPPGISDLQPSSNMEVSPGPVIEMDFANKNVGGGALSHGVDQGEIMMVQLPEMIAACLFMQPLHDNEVLFISGTKRYSQSSGYSDTFKFEGPFRGLGIHFKRTAL